jgi:energy-coupling factor transport system substrate-specific component
VPGYAGFSDRTGLYRHQDTQSFQTSYALQALPGIYRGKDMEKLFKTRFTTAVIVLIPACIGINYLGKLFAAALKLPLWLDCIGTCIGAVLGGPIIAGICGAANNLIYGLTTGDNITLIYALTSFGIGVGVGIMGRLGFMKSVGGAILTAVVGGLAAVLISTPLNIIFWGGTTGNVWGDAAFAATQAANMPVWLGSLIDEVLVDVPDKLVTLLVAYFILKGLPRKLTALYDVNAEIEHLD